MAKTIQFRIETSANLGALDQLISKMDAVAQTAARINTGKVGKIADLGSQIAQLNSLGQAAQKSSAQVASAGATFAKASSQLASSGASASTAASGLNSVGTAATSSSSKFAAMSAAANKMAGGIDKAIASARSTQTQFTSLSTAASKASLAFTTVGSGVGKLASSFGKLSGPLTTFTSKLASISAPMNKVVQQMAQFANSIASSMSSGLNRGAQTAQSFSRNTAAAFASLRSTLSGVGGAFTSFGASIKNSMDAANRAVKEFYSAGWSMLTSGYMVKNFGDKIGGGMAGALKGYLEYEKQLVKTATSASGVDPRTGKYVSANPAAIEEIIQNVQRGFGDRPPVYAFDATELAQGIYYYTSAIGIPAITEGPGRNIESISQQVSDLMSVASITGTSLETMTKGVMNIALEFGINPREAGNADLVSKISAQVGYLSNITTMEVPDIFEAFKMVGPMANILSGGNPGQGLEDTMTMLYFASEAGLKGGNVGRGVQAAFSSIIEPTAKMLKLSQTYFGLDGSKEAWDAKFFDPSGAFKGGIQGFMDNLFKSGVPQSDMLSMITGLFTNSAARSIVTQMLAYKNDPNAFPEISKMLASDSAEEWQSRAILMANDTINGNIQNLSNAWQRMQFNVITSISEPLKAGLGFVADLIWQISDAIAANPWVGKLAAGIVAFVAAIAGALGGLMMFGGTILLIMQALSRLGAVGAPLMAIFLGIGRAALMAVPMFLLLAAAFGLLMGAWVTDFGGIRSQITGLITGTSDAGSKLHGVLGDIGTGLRYAGLSFVEFFTGIVYGQGPIGDLAQTLSSVLGPLLGNAVMGKMIQLQGVFARLRESLGGIGDGFKGIGAPIRDAGMAVQGFFETMVMGIQRQESFAAANRLGDMLGIDNLGVKLQVAARAVGAGFNNIVVTAMAFGQSLRSEFTSIADNILQMASMNTLSLALGAVGSFIKGVATGLAGVFLGFIRGIEMATAALARLGEGGRWVADLVQTFTGFSLSLNSIAQAAGIAVGVLLGFRALSFLSPIVGIFATLAPIIGGVGLALAQGAIQAAVFVARMVLIGTAIAIQTVAIGLNAAATISSAAASMIKTAALAAEGGAATGTAGAYVALAAAVGIAVIPAMALAAAFGMLAIVFAGVAVAAGAIAIFLTGLAGAMFIVVGATQGFGAVLEGAAQFAQGLIAGLAPLGALIMVAVQAMASLGQAVGNLVANGNAFYGIGLLIGGAITVMVVGALAAAGAFALMALAMVAPFLPAIAAIFAFVAVLGLIGIAVLAATDSLDVFPNAVQTVMALAVGAVAAGADGIYNHLMAPFQRFMADIKELRKFPGFDQLFGLATGGADPSLLDNISAVWGTEQHPFLESSATWIADNLPGAFKDTGTQSASEFAKGWQDNIVSSFKGTALEGPLKQLMAMDWSKAWGTKEMDTVLNSMGQYEYLLDDTMVKWRKQAAAYADYMTLRKAVGSTIADEMMRSDGIPIPTDPGTLPEFYAKQAAEAEEGGNKVAKAIEEANKAIYDALSGLSVPEMTAKLFDINSGSGFKTGSAGGILATLGEDILGGIENKPDWLNFTELMADAQGSFGLSANLLGKNLHREFAPIMQHTADQLGIDVGVLTANLPTFFAPPELVPMATAEFLTNMGGISKEVYSKMDTFGIAEGWTEVGTKWSDVVDFAAAKSMTGEDWNFADFVAESYGISVKEAETAMAAAGIDPTVVTQDMFGDTALWAQSMGGQLTVLTEDMYNTAQDIMTKAGDKNIKLTEEQLANMDDNTKLYLDSLGYTFTKVSADDSELGLAADAEEKASAIADHAGKIAAAFAGVAANQDMEGTIAGFGDNFKAITASVKEGTTEMMVSFEDMDGTVITMPTVDAIPLIEGLNKGSTAVTEFYASLQDNIVAGNEGTVAGMQQIKDAWMWLDADTGVMMATLQDADGTVVVIPAAEIDAYLASLQKVNDKTRETQTALGKFIQDTIAPYQNSDPLGAAIADQIKNGIDPKGGLMDQSDIWGGAWADRTTKVVTKTSDQIRAEAGLPTKSAVDTALTEYTDQVAEVPTKIATQMSTQTPTPIDLGNVLKVDPASFDAFGTEFAAGITESLVTRMQTGGMSEGSASMFKPITDMMVASFGKELDNPEFKENFGKVFADTFGDIFSDLGEVRLPEGDMKAAGNGGLSASDNFGISIRSFATGMIEQMGLEVSREFADAKTGMGKIFSEAFGLLFEDLEIVPPSGGGDFSSGMAIGNGITGFVDSFVNNMKTTLTTELSTKLPQAFSSAFSSAFAGMSLSGGASEDFVGHPLAGMSDGGDFSGMATGFATSISTQIGDALETALSSGETGIGQAISTAINTALGALTSPDVGSATGGSNFLAGIGAWATGMATSMSTSISQELTTAFGTTLGPAISEAFSAAMASAMTSLSGGGGAVPQSSGDAEMGMSGTEGMFTGFAQSIVTSMKASLTAAFSGENGLSAAVSEAIMAAFASLTDANITSVSGMSDFSMDFSGWATGLAESMATQIGTDIKTSLGATLGPAIQTAFSEAMATAMTSLGGGGGAMDFVGHPATVGGGQFDGWAQGIATSMASSLKTAISAAVGPAIQEAMASAMAGGGGAGGAAAAAGEAVSGTSLTMKIAVELDMAAFGSSTTLLTGAIAALSATQKIKISVEADMLAFGTVVTQLTTDLATLSTSSKIIVTIEATDTASVKISAATELMNTYGALSPSPTLSVVDNASRTIEDVIGRCYTFSGLNPSTILTVIDNGSDVVRSVIELMGSVQSKTVTLTVNSVENVTRTVSGGTQSAGAKGGLIRDKFTLVGEDGPELVELPYNSRVYANQASNNILDQIGTASETSMNTQAARSFIPQTANIKIQDNTRSGSEKNTQPIIIQIDNITIAKEVDIDVALNEIDRRSGYRMELGNRGMISSDTMDNIRR